jgi:hypothetical protein
LPAGLDFQRLRNPNPQAGSLRHENRFSPKFSGCGFFSTLKQRFFLALRSAFL